MNIKNLLVAIALAFAAWYITNDETIVAKHHDESVSKYISVSHETSQKPDSAESQSDNTAVIIAGTVVTSPRYSYRLDSHVYSIGTGRNVPVSNGSGPKVDFTHSMMDEFQPKNAWVFMQEKLRRKLSTAQRLGMNHEQMFPEYADYFLQGMDRDYSDWAITEIDTVHDTRGTSDNINEMNPHAVARFHSQHTPFEDQSMVLTSLQLFYDIISVHPEQLLQLSFDSADSNFQVDEGIPNEPNIAAKDYDIDEISDGHYKLRQKFGLGGSGEVWHATRLFMTDFKHQDNLDQDEQEETTTQMEDGFVMKRIFVESGKTHLLSGYREAYFGELLRGVPHVTRYAESFNKTNGVNQVEFWLVFRNEGTSLSNLLYSTTQTSAGFSVVQSSRFWYDLRNPQRGSCKTCGATGVQVSPSHHESQNDFFQQQPRKYGGGMLFRREVLRQLLVALAELAKKGVAHRDIKPSNLLLNTSSSVVQLRVCDFGSAVDMQSINTLYGDDGPTQNQETREYQPPEAIFTRDVGGAQFPYFASPNGNAYKFQEQDENDEYCTKMFKDRKCFNENGDSSNVPKVEWYAFDIWSVGIVALEMLLGTSQIFTLDNRTRSIMEQRLRRQGKFNKVLLEQALAAAAFASFGITPLQDPHDFDQLSKRDSNSKEQYDSDSNLNDARLGIEAFNASVTNLDPFGVGFYGDYNGELELRLVWRLLQWSPFERISPSDALEHAYFKGKLFKCSKCGQTFELAREYHVHHCPTSVHTTTNVVEPSTGTIVVRNPTGINQEPFTIRPDKATGIVFRCPVCHREFSLFESCHQHITKRRHNTDLNKGTTCEYNHEGLPVCNPRTQLEPIVSRLHDDQIPSCIAKQVLATKWCGIQGRRAYYEDYYAQAIIQLNQQVCFAANVLDGHSGAKSARYAAKHLFSYIASESRGIAGGTVPDMIHKSFHAVNQRLRVSNDDKSGTTATVILVCASLNPTNTQLTTTETPKQSSSSSFHQQQEIKNELKQPQHETFDIHIGHVGDSRAVVCCNERGGILYETLDHSPEVPEELARIKRMGGFVTAGDKHSRWRVMGNLAVSRSLGDNYLGQYISSVPDLYSTVSTSNPALSFIVVGTDGLWDVVSSMEAITIVRSVHQRWNKQDDGVLGWVQNATQTLVQEAYVRYSLDNIGVVIIPLIT